MDLARATPIPATTGTSAAAGEAGLRGGAGDGVGPALDDRAKKAYRRRIHDLQAEMDEAHALQDAERLARAQEEFDALSGELSRAVGLGGRDRPVSSDHERARIAVTGAIRRAIERIVPRHRELGRHLAESIHTGTFCSYRPTAPVTWRFVPDNP